MKLKSFAILIFAASSALGQGQVVSENLVVSGDVSMLSAVSLKPSSVQQRSSFQMPEGRLGALWSFDSDMSLGGELLYGKSRDSVDGRYNLQLETIYFEFRKLLNESHWLQYGLISHPWEQLSEKFWNYRFLGARGPTLGFRYAYLNRSDLGISTGVNVGSWGRAALMAVNGEGAGSDEQGPRKDIHFIFEATPIELGDSAKKLTLALLVVEGAVDNIDPEVSQRERISFLMGLEQELGFSGSLELMTSKDPVDGINQVVADKVDLAAQGGQVARGQGGSLIAKWRGISSNGGSLGGGNAKTYEVFARVDQWNPATGVSGKGLRSQLLGIGFFPRQHLQLSLAWSEVLYENNHAASVRDSADLLLAARLKW